MDWDAVGAIGEIIGAVAVVVTLIYLAAQIRQNTKHLASTSLQALADRAENRVLLFASNPEFAAMYAKFQADPQSLSASEAVQLYGWIGAWLTDLEDTYRQFKLGTVEASTMQVRLRFFQSLCEAPIVREIWEESREFCEPEFADWLEGQIPE